MLTFADFRGGLWIPNDGSTLLEQAGFATPEDGLLTADNIDFLPTGGVRGRRGSTLYNTAPLGGPVVLLRRYYGRPTPQTGALGSPYGRSLDLGVGTAPWEFETAIEAAFGQQAQATLLPGVSTIYLVALAPFFHNPLPAGSTITGIEASVAAFGGPSSALPLEHSVTLLKAGAIVGDDKSSGAALTLINTSTVYGGPSDLWGSSWEPSDINDPGFAVAISYVGAGAAAGVARVDYIAVRVYYTQTEATTFIAAHTTGAALVYSKGTAGVFTPLSGGVLADPDRRPRAIHWPQKGKLFFFDGVNDVHQFDGMEMTEVEPEQIQGSALLPPRKGPFAALHKNRIYASDPGEPSAVYACDINNEKVWRPQVQLTVNDDRGGIVTGIESFGDSLLIFKDTAIFRFLGDPEFTGSLVQIAAFGCVAPYSLAVTPFGVIFLGRDGLWLCDGGNMSLLSAPIRGLFVDRDQQRIYPNAVGVYYPRRDQYVVQFDPEARGPGYVLHRIAMPQGDGTEQQRLAWSRIPGLPMNCGTVWDGREDEGELYLGDLDGVVWLRDVGAVDYILQYESAILTTERLLDRDRRIGRVNRIKPLYRGAGGLAMELRYDQPAGPQIPVNIGDADSTVRIQEPRKFITNMAQFGRFLSVAAATTEGPEFELHRIDCDVRLRGGRVWP